VFELLNDLQTAFINGREYFLGAIVTTKSEDGGVTAPYQARSPQCSALLHHSLRLLRHSRHLAGGQELLLR